MEYVYFETPQGAYIIPSGAVTLVRSVDTVKIRLGTRIPIIPIAGSIRIFATQTSAFEHMQSKVCCAPE